MITFQIIIKNQIQTEDCDNNINYRDQIISNQFLILNAKFIC